MQNITVIGRLGRDAELRQTAESTFLSFTIAASTKVRGVEKTTWYDVISFNEKDQRIKEYLKKGSNIVVIGELDLSIQDGRDGRPHLRAAIVADKITFAGGSSSGSTQDNSSAAASAPRAAAPVAEAQPQMSKPKAAKAATAAAPAPTVVEAAPVVEEPEEEPTDDLPF